MLDNIFVYLKERVYLSHLILACVILNGIAGFIQVSNKFLAFEFHEYATFLILYLAALFLCGGMLLVRRIKTLGLHRIVHSVRPAGPLSVRERVLYGLVIVLGQMVAPYLYFSALNITSIFTQSLIYLLYPVLTVLGGRILFRERTSACVNLGGMILFLSYLIYVADLIARRGDNVIGVVWLIGSAVALAAHKLIHKRLLLSAAARIDDLRLSFWGLLCGCLTAGVAVLAHKQFYFMYFFTRPDVVGQEWFFYTGFIVFLSLVYLAQHYVRNNILRHLEISRIFPFSVSSAVFAFFFAALFYLNFPTDFSFQLINAWHIFCMSGMFLGSLLILADDYQWRWAEALNTLRGRIAMIAICVSLLYAVLALSGSPLKVLNRNILSRHVPDAVIDLALGEQMGRVKEVAAVDCEEQFFSEWTYGYYFVTSRGAFVLECSEDFPDDYDAARIVPVYEYGRMLTLSDRSGGTLKVRYIEPMGARQYLFKAVDVETGRLLVVEQLYDDELETYTLLAERIQRLPSHNGPVEKLLVGRVLEGEYRGRHKLFRAVPFIYGKSFYKYFDFDIRGVREDGAFDLRPKGAHILEKTIEAGELSKAVYRLGLYNFGLTRENLMVYSGDLSLYMLFHIVRPILDVVPRSYADMGLSLNFMDLLSFLYPLDTVMSEPLPYLILTDDNALNDRVNAHLERIRDKILDHSYLYDKSVFDEEAASADRLIAGMDRFLDDLRVVKSALDGRAPLAGVYADSYLSEAQTADILAMMNSSAYEFLRVKLNAGETSEHVLTFLKVPSIINNQEDMVVLSGDFEGSDLERITYAWRLAYLDWKGKASVVVVSPRPLENGEKKALVQFLREHVSHEVRFVVMPQ